MQHRRALASLLSSLSGPTNSSNPSNPSIVSVVADSFGAYALGTGDQLTGGVSRDHNHLG